MQTYFFLPSVRIVAIIGLLLLSIVPLSPCEAQETRALQEKIDQEGGGWIVRDNEISQLPAEDRKKLLGTVIDPDFEALISPSVKRFTTLRAAALPAKLDYRNINGRNYITPVRNQGSCGSCWAFSTTAALETRVLRTYNRPGEDLDLAEQVLVSCSGAGSCGGGSPYIAGAFLKTTGIPLEACYPFTQTNGRCTDACGNQRGGVFTVTGDVYIQRTVNDLKRALNTYGPFTTAYTVYTDFYKYDKGVYRHVSGNQDGGHAVLLVGYDDDAQAFICKNSWGRQWGENGFFRIHYNMVNNDDVQFGIASVAYTGAIDPGRTNQLPRSRAGAVNDVSEGDHVALNGANSYDPDGEIVSYLWTRTNGPNVELTDADTATPEFTAPDIDDPAGDTLTFRLTVTDDDGGTDNDALSIRVLRKNQPPTAAANGSSPVIEGEKATLSGTNSTDPEGGALTFRWSQRSGPDVVLSDASSPTCTFTAPDTDDPDGVALTFQLTVTDDGNMSDQARVTVNVNWHNMPPEAAAGSDLHFSEGETVVLDGRGSVDPESHPLKYEWRQLTGETVTLSAPLSALTEFTAPDAEGTNGYALRFSLEVQDNGGLKATDEVIVNVSWVNDPPDAVVVGPETASAGDVITLDGTDSNDSDDGIVRYQWRQVAGEPVTLDTPDQATTIFTAPDPGEGELMQLKFELTVTDDGDLKGTDGITLTVNALDSSPVTPDSAEEDFKSGGGSGSGCWIGTISHSIR